MVNQDDKTKVLPQIRRSWRERMVLSMLITGGLLTMVWIVILTALAVQIIGAVAGTGGHG
jgi:hypothetical protein